MKRKIEYKDEPLKFEIVDDFLPPPEQLTLKKENVKVTIALSKNSVDFFKKYAQHCHSHYQAMIKKVLDYYVAHYQGVSPGYRGSQK